MNEVDVKQENLEIARQRLKEIDNTNGQDDLNHSEIEAAFLDDIQGPDYSLKQNKVGSLVSSLVILAILPISATAGYWILGNTKWLDKGAMSAPVQSKTHPGGDINAVIGGLEKSLEDNPDNVDGWKLAGRTWLSMGLYSKAEKAFEQADRLSGGNPDILTAWADASLMANGGQFTEDISLRIKRALNLDPNKKNALWIAGIGAQTRGDHEAALRHLQKLRPMLGNESNAARRVDSLIAQSIEAQSTDTRAAQPVLVANTENSEVGGVIHAEVDIAEDIRSMAKPTDIVFVFARAPDGPPFPLAVMRLTVADLPAKVTLDDSLAMIEGKNISSVEQVAVTARVSKGGKPIAQPGDLTSPPVTTSTNGAPDLSLLIDRVVQ